VHFTVGASKDVWAYDDEEGSEEGAEDDITAGEAGKPRVSLLSGSLRNRSGVEKRGNVTKVPVEVEVVPGAEGPVDVSVLPSPPLVA
jgi:dynactin-4